jgi:hypothetical protein
VFVEGCWRAAPSSSKLNSDKEQWATCGTTRRRGGRGGEGEYFEEALEGRAVVGAKRGVAPNRAVADNLSCLSLSFFIFVFC